MPRHFPCCDITEDAKELQCVQLMFGTPTFVTANFLSFGETNSKQISV